MITMERMSHLFNRSWGNLINDAQRGEKEVEEIIETFSPNIQDFYYDFTSGFSHKISEPTQEQFEALAVIFNVPLDNIISRWNLYYNSVKREIITPNHLDKRFCVKVPKDFLDYYPIILEAIQESIISGSPLNITVNDREVQRWIDDNINIICPEELVHGVQFSIKELPHECGEFIFTRVNGVAVSNVPHMVIHHSPTGFEWGYAGSGPSELALNILEYVLSYQGRILPRVDLYRNQTAQTFALKFAQNLKYDLIQHIPELGETFPFDNLVSFIESRYVIPATLEEIVEPKEEDMLIR